ncbi:MAG: hypothetical protein IKG15_09505 [Solobacterium sp.]|nr:hypothetical protein [Solobacterium sp.]
MSIKFEESPVWERYPGYSYPVQLYHSFDLLKSECARMSLEDLETYEYHVHLAHMLVMARMDEEDYKELLRSLEKEERIQARKDWMYVNSVFDDEFYQQVKEHTKHAGN